MNQDDLDRAAGFPDRFPPDGFSPELPAALARGRPLPLGLRLLMYMLEGVRIGALEVGLPDGSRRVFAGSERPELRGVLNIRDGRIVGHVLRNGEVGFGEAYLDGCWDSPDLAALLAVVYLNEPHYLGPYEKNWLGRLHGWWQHRRRHNSRDNARRNIEAHYDLGNDFYALWLDPTMAYSSAVFSRPGMTLEEGQREKFRRMAARLQLEPGHHLLEIGSGWGGFALHCAREHGCRVTSITLSAQQLEEAQRRAQEQGLADRVRFELRDYRDVRGRYDRVASIEMIEAVGEAYWGRYFEVIARALAPGGRAALQGITIDPAIFENYRTKRDFIQKYVFPGGMLATPQILERHANAAGLAVEDLRFHGSDYADTLALWQRNVAGHAGRIAAQFGERFLRLWRYYLAYCECGFRVERVNLVQLTLRR